MGHETLAHPPEPPSRRPPPAAPGIAPWRHPRYAFIRPLGHGGFGDVYLAHDAVRGHVVALKMLRGFGAEANQQLRREFRVLKDFDHPGIVELFELHIDEDECLFTMEFVRGQPITRASEAAPEAVRHERTRASIGALIDAVQALHDGGILHRDLKPSNILVTHEGRLVVLDAGLARLVDGSSRGSFAGSLTYMSPEQAQVGATSPASDWYAVGAIAYELFTGAPPFDGEPLLLSVQKSLKPPPSVAASCRQLSARDAAMIDRLLAIAPADRPRAEELAAWRAELAPSADADPPAHRWVGDATFVGRTREMSRLDALFEASSPDCRYVTISGPSGIGKTALLDEWMVRLGPRGDTAVFTGRCYQREAVPFNGFDGVFDALEAALVERLARKEALPDDVSIAVARVPAWTRLADRAAAQPGPSLPPDPIEQRRATARAIVRVLHFVVAARRLVLWVDDVQWGPIETAFLLAEIGRATWSAGALVLLSHRPLTTGDGPCITVLGDVVKLAAQVTLAPLEDDEARALIGANAAMALDDEAARRLVTDGGGHPLLLTQATPLLAALEGGTEARLDGLLRARVAALSERSRRLLVALCVARAPMTERAAAMVADGAAGDGEARRLMAMGLVRRAGSTGHLLTPFHDKLREVVLASLPVEELRDLNLRIAAVLEAEGEVEPEALIDYLIAGGERRRAYALVSEAAARMDRGFAFARAVELSRLALDLAAEFAEDRTQDARLALAEALVNCGRCHEAAQIFLAAAAHAKGEDADTLSGRAALELMRGGYIVDGLDLARRAFRRLGIKLSRTSVRALPSIIWDRLRLWRRGYRYELRADQQLGAEVLTRIDWCLGVGTVLPLVDTIRAFQVHNQGLRWALDAGEPKRLARVLAMESGYRNALNSGSDVEKRASQLLQSAEMLAASTGDPMARAVVEIMRASSLWSVGDWPRCVAAASEGARTLREHCRGASWEVNFAMTHMLDAMVWLADFEAHERTFRAELEDAIARGDRYAQLMYVVRDMMMNATVRDTLEEAEARADGVMSAFGDRGFQVEHLAELFERNHLALYRRQGDVGYGLYLAAWKGIRGSQLMQLKPFRIETRSGRGRAALLLASTLPRGRRRTSLVREAATLGRKIEAEPPGPRSLVLSCPLVAGAAYLQGDLDAAVARLERGVADAASAHMYAHEQAFRFVRARLRGGQQGNDDTRAALAALASRGVRRPERYIEVLVTGFGEVL
ncbi:MAG: protein kinase [Myxococcota bacterium]